MNNRSYRVYDKMSKQMLYPKQLSKMAVFIDAAGEPVQYKGGDRFAKLQNCVVMASTGMNTASGVPIWEDDVLDVQIPTEFGSFIPARGHMKWDDYDGRWSIQIPNPPVLVPSDSRFPVNSEDVIGNIHEHPTLLANGK